MKNLVDPETGITYEVDMAGLDSGGGNGGALPTPGGGPPATTTIPKHQEAIEQQLHWFLSTGMPQQLTDLFWALDHLLAITKIVDPYSLHNLELRIENLIRMYYLTHIDPKIQDGASEEKIMFWLEQLEVWAILMLQRSITYDDRPTEREHWNPANIWYRLGGGAMAPGDEGAENRGLLSAAWGGLKRRVMR